MIVAVNDQGEERDTHDARPFPRLQPEQEELLVALVEATRNVPRESRQRFMAVNPIFTRRSNRT
jgi:hypothetical protein